jgi:glyoxylase-like metal-dependent hydrolase (beta-lactamase superfamily II)/rhodanese-related sulfurtransferase
MSAVPELSAADLLRALEAEPAEATPQVLDVRAPERAAQGHIEAPFYVNIPGPRVLPLAESEALGLDPARPVAVVCDRGLSSRPVTELLLRRGFDARSLSGGMLGWAGVAARRPVPVVAGLDRLVQLDRVGKGALGYLAVRSGEALAVDPGRDLGPFLELLEESGARLIGVADTHCHADYLSGGPALAARFAVPYYLHPADAIDPHSGRKGRLVFSALADGQELAVGGAQFVVEHLPGHTEGSVALRLGDELALTGDLLFVASVGRPDLAGRTAAWTDLLFHSLARIKRAWSPGLRVLPAHYRAATERQASRVVEARFGDLASRLAPLGIADPAKFAAWVGAHTSTFPDEYQIIKQANLGLVHVAPGFADELEGGKSQCALGA